MKKFSTTPPTDLPRVIALPTALALTYVCYPIGPLRSILKFSRTWRALLRKMSPEIPLRTNTRMYAIAIALHITIYDYETTTCH